MFLYYSAGKIVFVVWSKIFIFFVINTSKYIGGYL